MNSSSGFAFIKAADWEPHAHLKHVFLAGNLQRPVPHPFFRRTDAEVVVGVYKAGDDGLPHWHAEVDEIDFIVSGRVGYLDVATSATHWFAAGDVISIPKMTCVQRLISEAARTLTIKLPSRSEKVHCIACPRECEHRREPYRPL